VTHACAVCHRPTRQLDGICLRHPETKRYLADHRHRLAELRLRVAKRAQELAILAQEIIALHVRGVDDPPDDLVERDEDLIRIALRLAYRIVGDR
jgi:hypothetical protein